MDTLNDIKEKISNDGFAIVDNFFTDEEIDSLLLTISRVDISRPSFRKTSELFAIRQFFKEIPSTIGQVFNDRFISIISELFGDDFFVINSIYFDKPENSNWFVSYHQDYIGGQKIGN